MSAWSRRCRHILFFWKHISIWDQNVCYIDVTFDVFHHYNTHSDLRSKYLFKKKYMSTSPSPGVHFGERNLFLSRIRRSNRIKSQVRPFFGDDTKGRRWRLRNVLKQIRNVLKQIFHRSRFGRSSTIDASMKKEDIHSTIIWRHITKDLWDGFVSTDHFWHSLIPIRSPCPLSKAAKYAGRCRRRDSLAQNLLPSRRCPRGRVFCSTRTEYRLGARCCFSALDHGPRDHLWP